MAPQTRSQGPFAASSIDNGLIQAAAPIPLSTTPSISRRSKDANSIRSKRSNRGNEPDEPPRFVIDLSLPPEQRYLEVCAALKSEMINLTSLFDEVVGEMVPFVSLKWLHRLCSTFLRGVYSKEENAELKGISKATGVDMYLLVCFNVLLDLFMGCSSGGAVVRAGADLDCGSKMVHFRTLDWDMDSLRRVVVQLDFVLDKDGPVVASSITYAGFVGVLTGVRKGLSLSLNFRHTRLGSGKLLPDMKYRWHLAMVLLGRRPSISTTLRQFMLPKKHTIQHTSEKDQELIWTSYHDAVKSMGGTKDNTPPIVSTSCYLCFSDGHETTIIEKDRVSATIRSSTEFIVVTNGDAEPISNDEQQHGRFVNSPMSEIFAESDERRQCAHDNWTSMRSAKLKRSGLNVQSKEEDPPSLMEVGDVIEMVQKYPITNECTHFGAVMDPTEGKVKWCRRWMQPVNDEWIRRHMSNT